jgi:hypothetical protein
MVWDINFDSDANVVEVAIKRLRAKLDGPFDTSCCTPSVAWAMCWRAAVSTNSIALRLSGMFTLVALLIFLLIGGALYQQVDRGLGLLPEAELDARYSVLESSVTRFGTPEHWVKIKAKLKLLAEKTSASVSGW